MIVGFVCKNCVFLLPVIISIGTLSHTRLEIFWGYHMCRSSEASMTWGKCGSLDGKIISGTWWMFFRDHWDIMGIPNQTHMLHGAGIFANFCPKNHPVL
jgi:hypothetical protein